MRLIDYLLARADSTVIRRALAMGNSLVRLPWPVPIWLHGQKVFVKSLDRLLAVALAKYLHAESYELELWSTHLRSGMVIADVGANLGLFSLIAASLVGPDGQVHSFEPAPANFHLLQMNVAANRHTNVVLHQVALADVEGSAPLFLCAEHHGDHRLLPASARGRTAIPVRVTTLDAVFEEEPRLDVVKMDIQGCEPRAIAGMKKLIDANPHLMVFLEFWPEGLSQAGSDPADFLGALRDLGFQARYIDEERRSLDLLSDLELLELSQKRGYTNLLLHRAA